MGSENIVGAYKFSVMGRAEEHDRPEDAYKVSVSGLWGLEVRGRVSFLIPPTPGLTPLCSPTGRVAPCNCM